MKQILVGENPCISVMQLWLHKIGQSLLKVRMGMTLLFCFNPFKWNICSFSRIVFMKKYKLYLYIYIF